MSDRTRLDLRVPAREYRRAKYDVLKRHGLLSDLDGVSSPADLADLTDEVLGSLLKGRLSRYVNEAIEEYLDEDRYSDLEEKVDRLIRAAGRSPDSAEEKNDLSGETTRAMVWVDEHLLAKFKSRVDEDNAERDSYAERQSYGEALGVALSERYDGGRAARLEDKLDRVIDDAESLLGELNDDTDSGLSKKERVTTAIATQLPDQFTEAELADAIDAETSGSDYYHEEYTDRVIDHKGVRRYERAGQPDLFLMQEAWAARTTGDIIENLGGDPIHDTAPETISKPTLQNAISDAGIDVSEENREQVNVYKDRVLDRLGYDWQAGIEMFAPSDDAESEDQPSDPGGEVQTSACDVASDQNGADSVADDLDALSDRATAVRADGGVVMDDG
ncbi:hypothetical protein [Halorientalis regularis]|nr:hypothetical protein [Halorientalis regularis]